MDEKRRLRWFAEDPEPRLAGAAQAVVGSLAASVGLDQPSYLENAQLYPAPDAALDAAMQEVWTEFLQH